MWIIDRIKKHYAKKAVARKLPRILKKKYGRHKRYSKEQIDTACFIVGIECAYTDYAYAMYTSRPVFNKIRQEDTDYDTLRNEIADSYFEGNSGFTIHDALDGASHDGGFFGGSDSIDSGGTDSGGDSDY